MFVALYRNGTLPLLAIPTSLHDADGEALHKAVIYHAQVGHGRAKLFVYVGVDKYLKEASRVFSTANFLHLQRRGSALRRST